MKVLHIEDRFHPGMGYQINFFARYHHPDHSLVILSSDSPRLWSASDGPLDLYAVDQAFCEEFDVSVKRLPSLLDRPSRQNLWLKGLKRAIRKIDPDILYVHTLESYTSIRILLSKGILSKYKVFFDTHTLHSQFRPGLKSTLFMSFFNKIFSKRIKRYGAQVFATVPENRMMLENEYGISKGHILYSPIGTDLSLYRFDEKARKDVRQKERIPDVGVVLLYTGKMNFRKTPHLILDAIQKVVDKVEIPLYIYFLGAADETYKVQYLDREFEQEHMSFRLKPAVPVSELYTWYSMADVAVFPHENTLSALDAQACRLPVIMSEDMTNSERLSQGGLTYTAGDLEDLSRKILELIDDKGKRQILGKKGEAFVHANYDYRKIVADMEKDLGLFD